MADPGELRGQLKAKDATIRELKQELQLSEMLVKELQTKVRNYQLERVMQRVLSCIRNQALFCAIGIMKANKAQAALDEVLEVVRVKDAKLMQRVKLLVDDSR